MSIFLKIEIQSISSLDSMNLKTVMESLPDVIFGIFPLWANVKSPNFLLCPNNGWASLILESVDNFEVPEVEYLT